MGEVIRTYRRKTDVDEGKIVDDDGYERVVSTIMTMQMNPWTSSTWLQCGRKLVLQ